MTKASKLFDFRERDKLLRDPDNADLYLADFLESGDVELVQEGLKHVAEVQETNENIEAIRAKILKAEKSGFSDKTPEELLEEIKNEMMKE